MIQSIAAARAGSQIYHAGKIGPDGQILLGALAENGINTEFIYRNASCSGHAVIQVNQYGNKSVLMHGGANLQIGKDEIDRVLGAFSAGDILILQNEISNLPYIIDKAFNKYMKVAFNPSPVNNKLKEADLSKISYLILNEIEGGELTGESRPNRIADSLLSRFPHLKIVLTLGKIGALYCDGMNRIQQGAYKVEAVDAGAAGDTFLGYFISRISMGAPSWSALRIAAMAAALSVTKKGALPSIPVWEDVLRFSGEKKS